MEMHQVRYFLAVCETLNFTRAAEQCHVSQPALTRAIKKLEDELGGPLLRRERNQTHLTDLGLLMRPHFAQTAAAATAARNQAERFRNLDTASLRLGMMCTIGPSRLLGFFSALRREMPSLEISLVEKAGHELVDGMMAGDLDLAMIGLPNLPERFDSRPLFRERYLVAFAPGHRFEAMENVPLKELHREDYLRRTKCEFPDHLDAAADKPDFTVRVIYESDREDWIQGLISGGIGCAVMPEYLQIMPDILTRPLIEPEFEREIALVSVAGRRFSPAVQAFVEFARTFDWQVPDAKVSP